MTGHAGCAAAIALTMLSLVATTPAARPSAAAPPPGGAQRPADAPDWLDAAPASVVTTAHLVAKAEAPDPPDADGVVTLRLRVTPRPEMRIYAHDVTGYVPLTLQLDLPRGAVARPVSYPTSVVYVFPPTGERSRVYSDPFTVTQRVRLPAGTSVDDVTGTLRYQACDDRLCYKPSRVQVAWPREPSR